MDVPLVDLSIGAALLTSSELVFGTLSGAPWGDATSVKKPLLRTLHNPTFMDSKQIVLGRSAGLLR